MDTLLENAQRIFDIARSGDDNQDFALLIRPDGGLHFVMESPFSIDAAATHAGSQTAFRITRSRGRVTVQGRSAHRDCILEERDPRRELLRDQALYRMTSPLLTSCEAASSSTAVTMLIPPFERPLERGVE
jgi:hypothetical protein